GTPVPAQTDAMNTNAGLCNDDASCTTGGFTSGNQSQTAGVFNAGSYYVVVGGCTGGAFTLHAQHVPLTAATSSFWYSERMRRTAPRSPATTMAERWVARVARVVAATTCRSARDSTTS